MDYILLHNPRGRFGGGMVTGGLVMNHSCTMSLESRQIIHEAFPERLAGLVYFLLQPELVDRSLAGRNTLLLLLTYQGFKTLLVLALTYNHIGSWGVISSMTTALFVVRWALVVRLLLHNTDSNGAPFEERFIPAPYAHMRANEIEMLNSQEARTAWYIYGNGYNQDDILVPGTLLRSRVESLPTMRVVSKKSRAGKVMGVDARAPTGSTANSATVFDDTCCICLDTFEHGSTAKQIQCGHVFHQGCLDVWLYRGTLDQVCPICKRGVWRRHETTSQYGSSGSSNMEPSHSHTGLHHIGVAFGPDTDEHRSTGEVEGEGAPSVHAARSDAAILPVDAAVADRQLL
jgi:hypothetical protein